MQKNIFLALIAGLLIIIFVYTRNSPTPPQDSTWEHDASTLASRLEKISLPALKEEGNALHTHQHLDILAGGETVRIPSNIGVGPSDSFIAPIHTHDETGIIHVESPTVEKFYLGQFFDVWGVRLDQNCILKYCKTGENLFEIYVNGKLHPGNPRDIELTPRQQIFIYAGSRDKRPSSIPSSYTFPADY